MKKTLLTLLALLPLTFVAKEATSGTMPPEWCEEKWQAETSALYPETGQSVNVAETWLKYKDQCEGTVTFESRLAIAYAMNGQFDNARNVSQSITAKDSKYEYLATFSGIAIDYFGIMHKDRISEFDVRTIKDKLVAYVGKYPDFPDANGLLGGLYSMLGEHQAAIASLERAKDTKMDASGVYRNLTISLTEVGRYQEAINAGNTAYRLKKAVTSDQYFAYAIAKADAGIGDFKSAITALQVIAHKKPEVRSDPEFKATVDFVKNKHNTAK